MSQAEFSIKQGDTAPSYQRTLYTNSRTREVQGLTGATVMFHMARRYSGELVIAEEATVVDDELGLVQYDWQSGDTTEPGDFYAEWEVTFQDGTVETFPNGSNEKIKVLRSLDAGPPGTLDNELYALQTDLESLETQVGDLDEGALADAIAEAVRLSSPPVLPSAYDGAATFDDGNDVWMFLSTRKNPDNPYLHRFNAQDPYTIETVEFEGLGGSDSVCTFYGATPENGYTYGDARMYVLFASDEAIQVAEVDPYTLEWSLVIDDDTHPSSIHDSSGPSIATDETNLYVTTYTSPHSLVLKYRLSDFTLQGTATLTGLEHGHASSWDWATSRLFCTGSEGWVAKVNPSGMTYTSVDTGSASHPHRFAMSTSHLWVTKEDSSGEVLRIAKSDLAITEIPTGHTGIGDGTFIDEYGGSSGIVFANFWPDNYGPAHLVAIDTTTAEIAYEVKLPNYMRLPNNMLFSWQDLPNGKFARAWVIALGDNAHMLDLYAETVDLRTS